MFSYSPASAGVEAGYNSVGPHGGPDVPGAKWRSAIPNREVDVSRPGSDLYALLGVAPTAGAAEIARAYRRRVREVHPDTAASAPDPAELRALQEAYLVLRDPARRAEYDADRARQAASPRVSRSVPVPVRVRSRAAPAADRLRAGPVRVEPLSPRRVQK